MSSSSMACTTCSVSGRELHRGIGCLPRSRHRHYCLPAGDGAAIMAEACGKTTGRPGICFVTRGPGATNAAAGLHVARQDSTPLILFVGQIARAMREREAFQELDYRAVFGSIARWVTEIDDPTRVPELISRGFYTATSGRRRTGGHRAAGGYAGGTRNRGGRTRLRADRDLAGRNRHEPVAEVHLEGGASDRSYRWQPLVTGRLHRFRALCRRFPRPVATTFRRSHLFDPPHRCYPATSASVPSPSCWRA